MNEFRFPVQLKESLYFAVTGKIESAQLYACGLPIGEYRADAAAVPAEIKETVASFIPGGRIVDLLHGEPLHAGLSPLATFTIVITAESTPSLSFIPVDTRPAPENGEYRTEIGGKTLVYTREWCGFE